MTDEHTKGSINRARGNLVEGFGRLTGSRRMQVKGKARQAQGDAQHGLGKIQNAIRRP
jgi:uncharacterized protein YjbJ (UPF0337 family)